MTDLSVNKKAIDTAAEIKGLQGTIDKAVESRMALSIAFFEPAKKLGATWEHLNGQGIDRKNNLWATVYDWAYETCAMVLVGKSGLEFVKNQTFTGKAEFTVTEGKIKSATPRTKQYIQAQIGKLVGTIRADVKKAVTLEAEGKDPKGKQEKAVHDDAHRFLLGLAKSQTQLSKKKPDGSIPDNWAEAFKTLMQVVNSK